MGSILYVEDDEILGNNFTELLEGEGFDVSIAKDADEATAQFNLQSLDLILLDIGLGADRDAGFSLCSFFRAKSPLIPIIFFTSHANEVDKISGMRLGADDYITKDISLGYLTVRIRSLLNRHATLKRTNLGSRSTVRLGSLVIDRNKSTVMWKGRPVKLTLTHFWIVKALVEHPGQVLNYQQLMEKANICVAPNTISAHIKSIRNIFMALDSEFGCIKTERSSGYRWLSDN